MVTRPGHRLTEEFWFSDESELILDQRRSHQEIKLFEKFFSKSKPYKAHLWLASSGSSTTEKLSTKLIGLGKSAILESAHSVNNFLKVTPSDHWALCLPEFHIGGLSIGARAALGKNKVLDLSQEKWSPREFADDFRKEQITLVSLVPTQIFDLVTSEIPAPESLRAVLVGGGALDPVLYQKARSLKWPLLPSFGMTEACSQVATAELDSLKSKEFPILKILPHFNYKIDAQGLLGIQGASLLTGFWQSEMEVPRFHLRDPNSYFQTTDFVQEIRPGFLRPLGRETDFVKILGEGVHLGQLEERFFRGLESQLVPLVALVAIPEKRKGFELILLTEVSSDLQLQEALQAWNQMCVPVERIAEIRKVAKIPRTSLGKIQRTLASRL